MPLWSPPLLLFVLSGVSNIMRLLRILFLGSPSLPLCWCRVCRVGTGKTSRQIMVETASSGKTLFSYVISFNCLLKILRVKNVRRLILSVCITVPCKRIFTPWKYLVLSYITTTSLYILLIFYVIRYHIKCDKMSMLDIYTSTY